MDISNYFLRDTDTNIYSDGVDWDFSSPKEYSMLPVQYGLNIDCPYQHLSALNSFLHPWHQLENNMFSHVVRQLDDMECPIDVQTIAELSRSVSAENSLPDETLLLQESRSEQPAPLVVNITVHTEIPHRDPGLLSLHSSTSMMHTF